MAWPDIGKEAFDPDAAARMFIDGFADDERRAVGAISKNTWTAKAVDDDDPLLKMLDCFQITVDVMADDLVLDLRPRALLPKEIVDLLRSCSVYVPQPSALERKRGDKITLRYVYSSSIAKAAVVEPGASIARFAACGGTY